MTDGDIAWVLISTALVLFMVPGLALFYGGMERSKNVLNMLNMNLYCLGVVPLVWVMVGFTLSAGDSGTAIIGNFDHLGLADIRGADAVVPFAFGMTFAAITPALISGAVAGRMRFGAWAVFVPVWSLVAYSPVVYWIYGGDGWIDDLPALDFAGGTAIHVNAGAAALALAIVVGRRRGWPDEGMPPHNLPMVVLGAGILWFGWFGFNAGSAGAADGVAAQAFLNTFIAGAAGLVGWMLVEWLREGHATSLGAASGVIAALVAITPAAGYVGAMHSIAFGFAAAVICFAAIRLKFRFGYDDSLDVVGVHLVGGVTGGLLLGLFADSSAVPGGGFIEGVFFGGGELLWNQFLSIVVVAAYSFAVTWLLAKAIDATIGLRVSPEAEIDGLDTAEHAETAYNQGVGGFDRIG